MERDARNLWPNTPGNGVYYLILKYDIYFEI